MRRSNFRIAPCPTTISMSRPMRPSSRTISSESEARSWVPNHVVGKLVGADFPVGPPDDENRFAPSSYVRIGWWLRVNL